MTRMSLMSLMSLLSRSRLSRRACMVDEFLQALHFIENAQEASAEVSQGILHFDRRFVAKHGALDDSETSHLPEALVHHFCG